MPEIYKYSIIVASTIFAAFGNYYFKLATANIHRPIDALKSKKVYVGILIYIASTLLYIVSHHFLRIYVIVAVASLTYLWTMVIAKLLLKEKVSTLKILGALLIIFGTVLSVYAKYRA